MTETGTTHVLDDAMTRYGGLLRQIPGLLDGSSAEPVAFRWPAPGPRLSSFHSASGIALHQLGSRHGHRLFLLDLMRNPRTRTTKTFASLSIVGRAVRHISEHGQPVLLITPTSGNKGTALRDAVGRAYAAGLVTPDELRIVTVAPAGSRDKLRDGPLSATSELRERNPVLLADVERPDAVKQLARQAWQHLNETHGRFLPWFTLAAANYGVADALRAFAEAELWPVRADSPARVHAHAVSSAYGLLGYHLGLQLLGGGTTELGVPARHPGFLLVQQLATPDMVLSLLGRPAPPRYEPAPGGGWSQAGGDAHFPAVTDDPAERLDPTFYTTAPPTAPEMAALVAAHGGTGVVVSRRECLDRYEDIGHLLAGTGHELPDNPAEIREWSLVKVLTGVLVAAERGLLPADADVVVHGSGHYTDETLPPLPSAAADEVTSVSDVDAALRKALR
ncbi:DUF6002 family protein [Amycolatopsis sp. cmx-4-83]|uniref:DUF6002 family protein n=1 Tax=Amycolatopsis sp. cmx-4-83 TaxID=2790940 RepID=UPI00397B06E3